MRRDRRHACAMLPAFLVLGLLIGSVTMVELADEETEP